MVDPSRNHVGLPEAAAAILTRLEGSDEILRDGQHPAALEASRKLQQIARSIAEGQDSRLSRRPAGHSLSALSRLTRICDQKFVTFTYSSIPVIWRIIYVDAQLLRAICILSCSSTASDSDKEIETLRRAIRDLDLALIVAGPKSLSKDQDCQDLILALQTRLNTLECCGQPHLRQQSVKTHRTRKRPRTVSPDPDDTVPSPLTQADSPIPEFAFDQAPSFLDLKNTASSPCSRPFIIRDFAQRAGWRAVPSPVATSHDSSWSSKDHLLRLTGPARVVPVEVGANYARQDWGQDVMLWSQFLELCGWDQPISHTHLLPQSADQCMSMLYMAQHDLAAQFPGLENDYILPDYVYMAPQAPREWPSYKPPASPNGVTTNLWIGPAGTVSPPHYDPYYNCFVQAVGSKEVWVAPPDCRPIARSDATISITETLMANTANVDVFDDQKAVPTAVRVNAFKAILGPGDLLFMPPGWWHSLRSLTRSFSVSMWF